MSVRRICQWPTLKASRSEPGRCLRSHGSTNGRCPPACGCFFRSPVPGGAGGSSILFFDLRATSSECRFRQARPALDAGGDVDPVAVDTVVLGKRVAKCKPMRTSMRRSDEMEALRS